MPAWLLLLLVMVGVTLAINPSREGYDWSLLRLNGQQGSGMRADRRTGP